MSELRVAMIGDTGVGKTSISQRYVNNEFSPSVMSTSGAAFLRKTVIDEQTQKQLKIQIWDTAGQEKFRSLTPMYYRSAEAVLIVYDVTRRTSFQDTEFWISEVRQRGAQNSLMILVANKIDKEQREVSKEEGELFAKNNTLLHFECSALQNQGIQEIFQHLTQWKLLNAQNSQQEKKQIITNKNVQQKSKCCFE